MGGVIVGTGVALPPHVVGNHDLSRIMHTSDEWIATRTGVRERRLAPPGVGSSHLAVEAGRAALVDAGVEPRQVEVVVCATMTPDLQAPGIAGAVQEGLGVGEVATFDLRQQCCGFLYGLDLADALIGSRRADTVLVVGAEVHAGYLPWGQVSWDHLLGRSPQPPPEEERERNTRFRGWSVLFGDGAGAMLVRRGESDAGLLVSRLHTDGTQRELIMVPGLGFVRRPYADLDQIDRDLHLPVMDGPGLYRQAVRRMATAVAEVTEAASIDVTDLDLVVAHQANDRILEGVRRQLGLPAEKVPSNIARYGNTTAATIPILYHELRGEGRVPAGGLVCFVAFGAGAHWGALLYREVGGTAGEPV